MLWVGLECLIFFFIRLALLPLDTRGMPLGLSRVRLRRSAAGRSGRSAESELSPGSVVRIGHGSGAQPAVGPRVLTIRSSAPVGRPRVFPAYALSPPAFSCKKVDPPAAKKKMRPAVRHLHTQKGGIGRRSRTSAATSRPHYHHPSTCHRTRLRCAAPGYAPAHPQRTP
jgi:hypothetical protein